MDNINEKELKSRDTIYVQKVEEEDKIIKYILNSTMFLGSLGFTIAGISSYTKTNILEFINANDIIFFPQGLTMCFYGILGLIFSINQILITYYKIGEGFNEFDKEKGTMRIYRKGGFPWKNTDINLIYSLTEILRIKICN